MLCCSSQRAASPAAMPLRPILLTALFSQRVATQELYSQGVLLVANSKAHACCIGLQLRTQDRAEDKRALLCAVAPCQQTLSSTRSTPAQARHAASGAVCVRDLGCKTVATPHLDLCTGKPVPTSHAAPREPVPRL